jgi:hypothetical protein
MSGGASDITQPGSFGATAFGGGSSSIVIIEDQMVLDLRFTAAYFPSLFPGGDNPGGAAEAELSSIIEFVMPFDDVIWGYFLTIDDTVQFSGSTSVVFENVTQSEVILDLTSPEADEGILESVHAGDLMRLTSIMSGTGDTGGPAGTRQYGADFQLGSVVPEPATLTMLLPAVAFVSHKRPRHAGTARPTRPL